jgi:signal transduction histidine kinase
VGDAEDDGQNRVDALVLQLREAREAARVSEERLRAAGRLTDEVVAITSHELQTPITAIVGASDALIATWDALDDGERRSLIEIIGRQGRRLGAIVDDLLTLASADAGSLRLELVRVDVGQLVAEVVATDPGLAGVEVDAPGVPIAWADPLRLEQIVVNYLSNACKYGDPPVRVEVRAKMGWVELRVHDCGSGVPAELQANLFGRFAPGGSRRARSTGLGLSIARSLARALDGDAWYEPSRYGGACFAARLPQG